MKMRMVKRLAALSLCIIVGAAAAFPLMGAAYAAADTSPTAGISDNAADSLTCICETKCSSASKNALCPVCLLGDDGYLNCTGAAPKPEPPAPACSCDVKCTETTKNPDCLICAADVSGCTGKEPEPAPTCTCDVKCTETTKNSDCLICAADVSGCTGKEPEPAPTCVCTVKCTDSTKNADCPVCAADVSGCTGKEPEPAPTCVCTVKCETGAVNGDCPVCKANLTGCTGKAPAPIPESGVTITIKSPSGWATRQAEATVRITDETGNGFAGAKVKIEKNGNWQEITDDLEQDGKTYEGAVELSENCTLYVSVTGKDGKTYEKSRYIECFDRTAPTIRASVDGRLLRAEAQDDLSGVAAIYVDGEKFTDLTNGTLDVRLRDLDCEFEQISVQAVDNAGNKSKTVQVKNPDYEKDKDKDNHNGKENEDRDTACSGDAKPQTKPDAPAQKPAAPAGNTAQKPAGAGSVSAGGTSSGTGKPSASASSDPEQETDTGPRDPAPFTPDGQATVVDNVTDEDGKEFYTFSTPDENVFYLVIDKQRDSDNVYFLNAVTEQDLMALAQKDEDSQESAVPDPEPVCACKEKCAAGQVNTDCPVCVNDLEGCAGEKPEPEPAEEPKEEPEKEGGGAGTLIFVLLAALAVGGAGYYFKIYRPKQELDDAEDFDELTGADGEVFFNEDELPEPATEGPAGLEPEEEPSSEPEEPDYPDDYPDSYADGEPEERG